MPVHYAPSFGARPVLVLVSVWCIAMAQHGNDALSAFMGAVAAPLRSVGLGRRTGSNSKNTHTSHQSATLLSTGMRSPRFYSPRFLKKSERGDYNPSVMLHRMNDAKWEFVSSGGSLGSDQRALSCDKDFGNQELYAAAAGPRLGTAGVTEFELTIIKSQSNSGSGMLLGVIEDVDFQGKNDNSWGRVWGLTPWNGRAFSFPHGNSRSASRSGERPGDALMQGDCRRRADGTIVRVRIDSGQRQLWFKVEPQGGQPARPTAAEQDWVMAQDGGRAIVLPTDVAFRPFARCAQIGECILIGAEIKCSDDTPLPARRRSAETLAQTLADEDSIMTDVTPVEKRSQAAATRHVQQDKQRPEAKREAELVEQVEKLKKELEITRVMLETERMLRRKAEAAVQQASEQRAEAAIQEQKGQGRTSEVSVADRSSAHEIQASLLRQVMLSEVDLGKDSGSRSRRVSRERQVQLEGAPPVSKETQDERPIWDGIQRPRRRSRDSLSSIDLKAF